MEKTGFKQYSIPLYWKDNHVLSIIDALVIKNPTSESQLKTGALFQRPVIGMIALLASQLDKSHGVDSFSCFSLNLEFLL